MANAEHVEIVKRGTAAIAAWREAHPRVRLDLRHADLRHANLSHADLSRAKLSDANLRSTNLRDANLHRADLHRANLFGANLRATDLKKVMLQEADLREADLRVADLCVAELRDADLRDADLRSADFRNSDLREANLRNAKLSRTLFDFADLSTAKGLAFCRHFGPSDLGLRTLELSGLLPVEFLRGCGLSDSEIEFAKLYQPGLSDQEKIDITYRIAELTTGDAIQYYTCFISYSSADDAFARRLHADLQNHGVRCWFAPHDLKIGDRFQDTIDRAIRLRDKLLVILSEHALASEWVEDEIQAALDEERRGGERRTVLFPLRIDDAVEDADVAWAARIRRTRHIGDFSRWHEPEAYQAALARLLRDLRAGDEA